MSKITLKTITDAISNVEKLIQHDGRKTMPEELETISEIVGKIAYPSEFHVARAIGISVKELDGIQENNPNVKYELMKYKEFCVQYHKDSAMKKGANSLLSTFMKEDFQIGADDRELIKLNIIDPRHENHEDDIHEYDEVEEEFNAKEKPKAKRKTLQTKSKK